MRKALTTSTITLLVLLGTSCEKFNDTTTYPTYAVCGYYSDANLNPVVTQDNDVITITGIELEPWDNLNLSYSLHFYTDNFTGRNKSFELITDITTITNGITDITVEFISGNAIYYNNTETLEISFATVSSLNPADTIQSNYTLTKLGQ